MKRQEIVKVCDRCPLGKRPVKATRTITFGFGDTFWDIDVCEKHGNDLERDLYAWGLLGRAVEDAPTPGRTSLRFNYSSDEARRLAELRTQQSSEDRVREGLIAGAREVVPIAEAKGTQPAAPPDAGDWVFTDHAIARMAERGVKAIDAVWAAAAPTVKRPGKEKGLMVHERGCTKVVVNPSTKTIITVSIPDRKAIAL